MGDNDRSKEMQDMHLIEEKIGEQAAELIFQSRAKQADVEKRLAVVEAQKPGTWLDTAEGKSFQEKWLKDYKALTDELAAVKEANIKTQAEKDALEQLFINLKRAPVSAGDSNVDSVEQLHELVEKNLYHLGQSAMGQAVEGDCIMTEEEKKSYDAGVAYGRPQRQVDQLKTMQTVSYGRAGVLMMPTQILNQITDNVVQDVSNISQFCTTYRTAAESLMFPKTTAHGVAGWIGAEGATRTADTTVTFGSTTVTLHWLYTRYAIGIRALRYGDFPLTSIMFKEYQDAMSKLIGTAQFTGTGIQEPPGIMNDSDIASRSQGEAATLTNTKALVKLFTDFKPLYRANLRAIFNRATEGILLTIEDGVGRYILREFGESGEFRMRGKPVHLAEDMPDVGAGTYPIIIGDFKRGCVVLLPKQGTIQLEDRVTNATTGIINYQATTTFGFGVLVAEAMKKLLIQV